MHKSAHKLVQSVISTKNVVFMAKNDLWIRFGNIPLRKVQFHDIQNKTKSTESRKKIEHDLQYNFVSARINRSME